jgi:hypothetical protein
MEGDCKCANHVLLSNTLHLHRNSVEQLPEVLNGLWRPRYLFDGSENQLFWVILTMTEDFAQTNSRWALF